MAKRFVTRRPFDYGPEQWDRGQLVELAGLCNDEKLLRLGYLKEYTGTGRGSECGVCSARFVDEQTRGAHGEKRHPGRFLTEEEQERREDHEERRLNEESPLYLDKTKAHRSNAATA